jgi:hypothetical protein
MKAPSGRSGLVAAPARSSVEEIGVINTAITASRSAFGHHPQRRRATRMCGRRHVRLQSLTQKALGALPLGAVQAQSAGPLTMRYR